jgi:transcription initiation factor TFIIH subunit 1
LHHCFQFVHRDRGRIGTAARHHASSSSQEANDKKDKAAKSGGNTLSVEEQEARAAAIGTDDLFSRYDQKLREASGESAGITTAPPTTSNSVRGNRLAVGQFDLVSTMSSERGELLQGPRDYHPPNPILNDDDEGKGSRVIRKYNRHWAMVLHPDEAVAGSNLMEVARLSVLEDADNDVEEAKPGGGVHEEMQRLVDLVVASEEGGDDEEEEFTLKNVEAYYTGRMLEKKDAQVDSEEARQRYAVFSQRIAAKVRDLAAPLRTPGTNPNNTAFSHDECFPTPVLGRELLSALTKKMSQDSKTEAETQDVVNSLPEEFLKRLQSYFRRSSELLRHFFGLRQLPEHANSEKMARIVQGMETVYKEVDGMRKELPQSELGEVMRKMCFPIMVQLDWAFKLRREGSGVSTGRSGGFVTVEELY